MVMTVLSVAISADTLQFERIALYLLYSPYPGIALHHPPVIPIASFPVLGLLFPIFLFLELVSIVENIHQVLLKG